MLKKVLWFVCIVALIASGMAPAPALAAAPLNVPASDQGPFVHGPDSMWGLGYQYPYDLIGLPPAAAAFLCSQAQAEVTILALGLHTNIVQSVQSCPAQMQIYMIIWFGGAKSTAGEGNLQVNASKVKLSWLAELLR